MTTRECSSLTEILSFSFERWMLGGISLEVFNRFIKLAVSQDFEVFKFYLAVEL